MAIQTLAQAQADLQERQTRWEETDKRILGRVDIYEPCNWLERFIEKIKPYRRICSQFEKLVTVAPYRDLPPTPVTRFASL